MSIVDNILIVLCLLLGSAALISTLRSFKWMARAVKAEAALQGYGEARQRQAIEDAARRLRFDERDGGGDG